MDNFSAIFNESSPIKKWIYLCHFLIHMLSVLQKGLNEQKYSKDEGIKWYPKQFFYTRVLHKFDAPILASDAFDSKGEVNQSRPSKIRHIRKDSLAFLERLVHWPRSICSARFYPYKLEF